MKHPSDMPMPRLELCDPMYYQLDHGGAPTHDYIKTSLADLCLKIVCHILLGADNDERKPINI